MQEDETGGRAGNSSLQDASRAVVRAVRFGGALRALDNRIRPSARFCSASFFSAWRPPQHGRFECGPEVSASTISAWFQRRVSCFTWLIISFELRNPPSQRRGVDGASRKKDPEAPDPGNQSRTFWTAKRRILDSFPLPNGYWAVPYPVALSGKAAWRLVSGLRGWRVRALA